MDEEEYTTIFPNNTNMQPDEYARAIRTTRFNFFMAISSSGIMTLGMCCNSLVVIAVTKFSHMRSTTNLLLVNLAIIDFLTLLFEMPYFIYTFFFGGFKVWISGQIHCYGLEFVYWATSNASLFTLAIVATERYFAICQPLKVSSIFSRLRVICAIGSVWILSTSISIPSTYSMTYEYNEYRNIYDCYYTKSEWLFYYFNGVDLIRLITVVMTFILYFFICKTLYRSIKSSDLQRSGNHLDIERKQVLKMIATINIIFLICWLPNVIFLTLLRHGYLDMGENTNSRLLWNGQLKDQANIYSINICNSRRFFRYK